MILAIALVCFLAQVVAWVLLPATANTEMVPVPVETEGMETVAA